MLNLDCPNCGKPHRVDNAFRGGVARCDSCGALIHVPTRDGKPIEAQTGRKKRPGAPAGITGSTDKRARRTKTGPANALRPARRVPGRPVVITLAIVTIALGAGAAWLIYQTALKMRGMG